VPERLHQPTDNQGEERGKERQIRDERRIDEHRHNRVKRSVHHHHARDPIEGAGEVDDAGDESETERAGRRATIDGNQKRRERDPAEGGMAGAWKAEGQQHARDGCQNGRQAVALSGHVVWRFGRVVTSPRRG
jgi:hypothetical protein